ncbi:MAG: SUMF1/EgtB/PvdO family nonheme iron enzyme [bacterium]
MKILVALGDSEAANSLSQILASLGRPASGLATDSDAVFAWINANGGCDLLISEVYFAHLDGFTVRDAIVPYLPDLQTIFTSQHDISPYADRLGGAPFLPQPINPETLAQTLTALGIAVDAPTSVATPVPPQANASATPAVKAQPKPAAAPVGAPQPKSAAVGPKASPAAAPKAAAKPVAKATASKAVAKPATASPKTPPLPSKADLPPDEWVGKNLGHYAIEARIRELETETFYRAKQTNIGRPVILRVLKPAFSADPAHVTKFMDDARAKARVTHILVTAVYESGVQDGLAFYSNEAVPAPTLEDLIDNNRKIDTTTALQIVKSVSEVFDFFEKQGIARASLLPRHIILKPGSAPRLTNMACKEPPEPLDHQKEIQNLTGLLLPLLATDASTSVARKALVEIRNSDPSTATWASIAQLAESRIPQAAPADAHEIQSQTIARQRALEESKKTSRRHLMIYSTISLTLTMVAGFFVIRALSRNDVHIKDLGKMIEIPAGRVTIDGKKVDVPAFKISKYEVTIAEYAAFLQDLKENPGKEASIAHPKQPPGKSHVPAGWADMTEINPPNPGYYTRAKNWGRYQEVPLSVDSPVFGVDWFDAYAYAKWKGKRLPTEQEWQRAASGDKNLLHPWGNEFDNKLANTGSDFSPNPDPKVGAQNDGFKRWSPVNKPPSDLSSFGIQGMAGNVSEWTDSWAEDAERTGDKVPVYRGGNWKTADDKTIMRRGTKLTEFQSDDALGFRIAEDNK